MKRCSGCRLELPRTSFGTAKGRPDGLNHRCRPCAAQQSRQWRAANRDRANANKRRSRAANPEKDAEYHRRYRESHPERLRGARLQSRFGISMEEYVSLLAFHGGGCASCGAKTPGGNSDDPLSFAVDHDHACCPGKKSCGRCVRALLCFLCNTGIGRLGDSAAGLRRALAVLDNPPASAWRAATLALAA